MGRLLLDLPCSFPLAAWPTQQLLALPRASSRGSWCVPPAPTTGVCGEERRPHTGELHSALPDGQRLHDLEIAPDTINGQRMKFRSGGLLKENVDPIPTVPASSPGATCCRPS